MDKALDQNIHPIYRKIRTKLYDWFSESLKIKQEVRQGGIFSTHLYKIFKQYLMEELQQNTFGYHLGYIYIYIHIGAPTGQMI